MPETEPTEFNSLPLDLVSQSGLAVIMGVSKQRVHQLNESGDLPTPYATVDGEKMVWSREQAEQFAIERRQTLGRVSLEE